MSLSANSTLTHIPAWKKLGLKLKFAKEEPNDAVKHHDEHIRAANGQKRKLADISNDAQRTPTGMPTEKTKKMKMKKGGPEERISAEDSFTALNASHETPPHVILSVSRTKRKSVSFTPETKTQDGEGVKQLYKTWLDKQIALDPSFNPSTISPALRSIEPTTAASNGPVLHLHLPATAKSTPDSDPPSKKVKKLKSEKNQRRPNFSPSTSPATSAPTEHPALTYLTTHHTSLSTWKFSKPHQNHLLKHLFSPTHIPPSYDHALFGYIRGLQGSARSRIRQQALATRSEDVKWLSSEPDENEKMDQETNEQCIARRKRDYDAAVARIKQQLRDKEDEREDREWELLGDKEEWECHVRKRRRAEVVLWGVGEEEEVVKQVVPQPKHVVSGNARHAGGEPITLQSRGMGGVKEISNGGIAKGSVGKKIVFCGNGTDATHKLQALDATDGIKEEKSMNDVDGANGANGVQTKKRRKRNKKRTDVPDDDSSSSESSSGSEEGEAETLEAPRDKMQQPRINGIWGSSLQASYSSSSDSNSGSESSSEDSE